MDNSFFHKETKNTPRMSFDPDSNEFEITGRSFHENPEKIYNQAIIWAENFKPKKGSKICLIIHFTYLSSTSVIFLLRLLKMFDALDNDSCKITVSWQYTEDDEIILVTGEDLESLVDMDFEFKPI